MTRTVKLEFGGKLRVVEATAGVLLCQESTQIGLTDRDLSRLIAALARTKAARNARRAALCVQASGER